jgi:hypothetical protein
MPLKQRIKRRVQSRALIFDWTRGPSLSCRTSLPANTYDIHTSGKMSCSLLGSSPSPSRLRRATSPPLRGDEEPPAASLTPFLSPARSAGEVARRSRDGEGGACHTRHVHLQRPAPGNRSGMCESDRSEYAGRGMTAASVSPVANGRRLARASMRSSFSLRKRRRCRQADGGPAQTLNPNCHRYKWTHAI